MNKKIIHVIKGWVRTIKNDIVGLCKQSPDIARIGVDGKFSLKSERRNDHMIKVGVAIYRWDFPGARSSATPSSLLPSCWAGHGIFTNILGYSIPYLRDEWLRCLMMGVEEQESLIHHFWRSWRSNQRPWGLALTSRTPSSGITWLNSCRPWMNPLFQVGSPLFWIHDLMGWPNNLEWSGLGSGATTMWNINSLPSLGLFVGII